MKFIPQSIPEIILIELKVYNDDRGYFIETFRKDKLEKFLNHKINFVQDNETQSKKGVLRGLHFQTPPFAQSKLIRVTKGSVLDVIVDIRKNSPTLGKHISIELNSENKNLCFIPKGFAHGFISLSDEVIFSYKVDNYYSPKNDRGINFKDPLLKINWKFPIKSIITSSQDNQNTSLKDCIDYFNYETDYYK